MADGATNRTNWALGVALLAALLVIAFLLGRESTRLASPDEAEATPSEVRVDVAAPIANSELPEPDEDLSNAPFSWELDGSKADPKPPGQARIERRADGRIVLSNRRPGNESNDETESSKSAPPKQTGPSTGSVDAYFAKLDTVQSEQEAADPKAFAMSILKASMSGSTEGLDQLIADTEQMEEEIKLITPPPSCAQYHEATLDALDEGRSVLADLRDAMRERDVQKVMAVAQRATALQAKTAELEAMEERLRAQ